MNTFLGGCRRAAGLLFVLLSKKERRKFILQSFVLSFLHSFIYSPFFHPSISIFHPLSIMSAAPSKTNVCSNASWCNPLMAVAGAGALAALLFFGFKCYKCNSCCSRKACCSGAAVCNCSQTGNCSCPDGACFCPGCKKHSR